MHERNMFCTIPHRCLLISDISFFFSPSFSLFPPFFPFFPFFFFFLRHFHHILFEKAKSQVLDQILELPTSVKPKEWETELLTRLWDKASHHVLEQIFLPSAIKAEGSAVDSFILQRCPGKCLTGFAKRSFGHKNDARKSFRSIIGDLRFPPFCYFISLWNSQFGPILT